MPNSIGEGIAEGTDNFIKMYFMTHDRSRQEKLDKIKPAIEAIQTQLKDDTIPLDNRRELLNTLEQVYAGAGIKIKLPQGQTLADLIMPRHVLDQLVDTGEKEQAVNAVPEGTSTDVITTSPTDIPLQRRRGELSQAELLMGLQRKAARGREEDEADIRTKQAKELAIYNFNLQQQLQQNGYTKNPEEVVEPNTGRTWSVYTNPKGDSQFVPLGAYHNDRGELIKQPEENTIPVSTYNAREKAKSGGMGATLKQLIFAASRELGLPQDDEAVLNLAGQRYNEQYLARTNNLNLGGQRTEQDVSGTRKIQPAEQARLDQTEKQFQFAQTQHKASVQARIDEAQPDIEAADEEINSIQSQIDTYKNQIDDLVKNQGYEKEDDEVTKIQKEIDNLTRQQNAAKRRKGVAEGRKNKATKELEELDKLYSSSTSSSNLRYTPQQEAAISAFQNNPNNKAKGADKMTKEQVRDILIRAGRFPQ